ncbi:alpha/beta-hydrolase [Xylariomycetidae sp. FL2044]|nr:alpha/beta-hydrolase [Xylariomycetidae sp. FL2044]
MISTCFTLFRTLDSHAIIYVLFFISPVFLPPVNMSTKPTIVLVPGAWQKPRAWNTLLAKLQDAGYATELAVLPTVGGTELPLAGLAEDVAVVQSILNKLKAEGKKSLLLCHSSGGVVGSNSVKGFDVEGIIYMAAFMIQSGKSLLDMLGGQPLPWMNVQGDRVTGVPEMLPQVAFNDLDPKAQEEWGKEMTHTSAALFATPSGFEPWANGVPCGYIFCTEDNALPYPLQQLMSQQLGPEPVSATIKSSHCPHLSIPDELVSAIKSVEEGLAKKVSQ